MAGEHEPMLLAAKPDQRKAQQRRRREIEALGAILHQNVGQTLLASRFIKQREIEAAPRRPHPSYDDLHRPAQVLMLKAGAQAPVAFHKGLHGRCQRGPVERPLQREHQLHRVDVQRLRIVKRIK
jgi:hypothetical protein